MMRCDFYGNVRFSEQQLEKIDDPQRMTRPELTLHDIKGNKSEFEHKISYIEPIAVADHAFQLKLRGIRMLKMTSMHARSPSTLSRSSAVPSALNSAESSK